MVTTTRYSVIFQKFPSRVRVAQNIPSSIRVAGTRWGLVSSRQRSVRGCTLQKSFHFQNNISCSIFCQDIIRPGVCYWPPPTMLQFLEGSLIVENSVALPRSSLDLSGLTNSITSALASININTLLPVILAIKAAFIIGILVKDKIGFLFPYPIHAVPLTKVSTFPYFDEQN